MKVFLFDIDGTLTPPRRSMESSHTMYFLNWMVGKKVYLVSGSDRYKVLEQVPSSILSRCEGVFCSMANEFWGSKDDSVYKNEWEAPINLLKDLNQILLESEYGVRRGNHIEHRTGMINFSVVGRQASREEREEYFNWDKLNRERVGIVDSLKDKYKDLDFNIGGQISIDINPKGANKSQASKWVRENSLEEIEFVFFGDKCQKGGNDYDIVKDIHENKDGVYFNVEGPEETLRILGAKY